jgi:uncharacterized protein
MRIPTDAEILALHTKHAPTPAALNLVYGHCLIVRGIAGQFLARADDDDVDADLVRAGALLHDIGVYRLYDEAGELDHENYIRHGVLGHELLAGEGLPERICRFASHHTGVGISRSDVIRQGLPLPPGDYMAETREETIVMYADKFHTKAVLPAPQPEAAAERARLPLRADLPAPQPPWADLPGFQTAAEYSAAVGRFGADKMAAFEALRARFGDPDLTSLRDGYGQSLAS